MSQEFFEFGSNVSPAKYHARLAESRIFPDGLSLEDHLLIGDYSGISFPIMFKHENQHKPYDILDTGTGWFYLISDHLRSFLKENQFNGWQIFPIKLLDKDQKEIPGCYGFSILGRSGPIKFNNSKIITKQSYENGPKWKCYVGTDIDLAEWDGSDFFLPKNTFSTYVVERVAKKLKDSKFSNIRLIKATDVETDEDTVLLSMKRN